MQVVREALDKPKNVTFKGTTDLVTDTDKASETAVLGCLGEIFPEWVPDLILTFWVTKDSQKQLFIL